MVNMQAIASWAASERNACMICLVIVTVHITAHVHTAGDVSPRRITSVGFCGAGTVSTLAASWLAVQWPTADVRCISFGAPALGNVEFAAAFK